jgi:predicted extracellular nuclease
LSNRSSGVDIGHKRGCATFVAPLQHTSVSLEFLLGRFLRQPFYSLILCSLLTAACGSAQVVISQIYGGGGNSGTALKNDFVELFNAGGSAVDLTGWSVQYASSSGSSWQVTRISGVLAAGQYFLVQESAGAGGTTNLPAPDAFGSIAMSATAGKVALEGI